MDDTSAAAPVLDSLVESGVLENLSPPLQAAMFLGSLVFLTAILVSVTSFTRIVIVLSFVRRALATQEIPSTPTVIGLALFLTMFTMGPVIEDVHSDAILPYMSDDEAIKISGPEAIRIAKSRLQKFMLKHTRKNDLYMFVQLSKRPPPSTAMDTPFSTLVPAFMISELKTAFIMGFCIYVPFILIDLLVSTVLMSLGMMMMPPVVVSAPIKLLLFILVDGWYLVAKALGASFLS